MGRSEPFLARPVPKSVGRRLGGELCRRVALLLLSAALTRVGLGQAPAAPLPAFAISRASGPITIDGDLTDPGWKGATEVTTFWETSPGDNLPAKVRTVAYLT